MEARDAARTTGARSRIAAETADRAWRDASDSVAWHAADREGWLGGLACLHGGESNQGSARPDKQTDVRQYHRSYRRSATSHVSQESEDRFRLSIVPQSFC